MTRTFQSMIFSTPMALARSVAYEWMTAGGLNSPAMVDRYIASTTPAAAAAECLEGWDLSEDWLSERDLDAAAIEDAFTRFFAGRPDKV